MSPAPSGGGLALPVFPQCPDGKIEEGKGGGREPCFLGGEANGKPQTPILWGGREPRTASTELLPPSLGLIFEAGPSPRGENPPFRPDFVLSLFSRIKGRHGGGGRPAPLLRGRGEVPKASGCPVGSGGRAAGAPPSSGHCLRGRRCWPGVGSPWQHNLLPLAPRRRG